MRLELLSKRELMNHALCLSGLTELEQALLNSLEEEPDADVVEELEDSNCKLQSDYDEVECSNEELKDSITAIDDILGDIDEKDKLGAIKELIKEYL